MPGFKTHITTSTVLGIGYAGAGYALLDAPIEACVLAGSLCSVAGMLPDLDSDTGVPIREAMAFTAAVVPMLMLDRFQHMGMSHEMIVGVSVLLYIVVRFGAAWALKKYTVHRGMWHSIPALAISGLAGFLICSCQDMDMRLFKAFAIMLGFASHLLLDEFYSIDTSGGSLRLKKSSGTAIKFFSGSLWANISTYAKLILLLTLAVGDPFVMEHYGYHKGEIREIATDYVEKVLR
jgi:membrane-bound metal-dependent hydrolase YbcI (DUF457 family)